MSYSTIQLAREEFGKYESEYQELVKKINLSLFSLSRTNLNSEEKKKLWQGLSEYTKNIIDKAGKKLDELDNIRFSESEVVLQEEKDALAQKYNLLISDLRKEKETILRQIGREAIPFTPLRQKVLNLGHCYFDDISIASNFPYKLKKEEQTVLGIEIPEGAVFCSQECLLGYCKEYRSREKLRQEEEKKNKEKIESDRELVTKIQGKIGKLLNKINDLEKEERELESLEQSTRGDESRNVGFFGRIGRRLGLVKENNPRLLLETNRKTKASLGMELERKNEELQRALIILSADEQMEGERQKNEKRFIQQAEKITSKEEEKDNK